MFLVKSEIRDQIFTLNLVYNSFAKTFNLKWFGFDSSKEHPCFARYHVRLIRFAFQTHRNRHGQRDSFNRTSIVPIFSFE